MIVNGKYVQYDEKKSAVIQRDFNALDDIQQSVKSNVKDPNKVMDTLEGGASVDFGFSGFQDNEVHADRVQKYGYYREMAQMEFIQRGIEIIADDSTLKNLEDNVIKITSNNEAIKEVLWDLFIERIDINSELWSIVYETVKMGDNFYEIIPDSYENPSKIMYIRYLNPENVERVEVNGRLIYYTYRSYEDREENEFEYNSTQTKEIIYRLQPWQIVHFKVKDDKDDNPYGASLLKAGVRTFRRLTLLEDVILVYRISRAPERRVFYIDVGNMNYTDSKKFIQKLKAQYRTQNFLDEDGNINRKANVLSITSDIFVPQKEGGVGTKIDTLPAGEGLKSIEDLDYFKNKILRLMNIPPAFMGDDTDNSQGSLCLAPETKIKLADGRNLEIKEIAEEFRQGKQNYVYSIDEHNEWVIKPVSWAGITKRNAETIEVLLDNGEKVVCTPEHRFMLRDGSYVEAQHLKEGSSLMPIYTKISSNKEKVKGYEKILNNNTGKWEYTHRVSAKNNLLGEEGKNSIVVHHVDFNKRNNNPINLKIMGKDEHLLYHTYFLEKNITPEVTQKRNKSIKEFYSTEKGKEIIRILSRKGVASQKRKEWFSSEEHKQMKREQIKRQREEGTIYITDEGRKKLSNKMKERWEDEDYKNFMLPISSKAGSMKNKNNPIYRKLRIKEIIEAYEYPMTTEDLSAKLDTTRGTLKRSLRREGYKDWFEFCDKHGLTPYRPYNHKVVSISSHRVLDEVYDITVDNETPNFALSCGIVVHNSQLDYRFSRFIERVQTQIFKGMEKIAAVELYFQGYKKSDLSEFRLEPTPSSNIAEITDIDIMNQRMSLITTIKDTGLFDNEWILKNIIKFSDKEISDITLRLQMQRQQQPEEEMGGGMGMGAGGMGGAMGPGMEGPMGAEDEFGTEPGATPPLGAESPATAPVEAPGGPPEESVRDKSQMISEALVGVLGKDFIIRENKDFFAMMKYIKEDRHNDVVPLMERASEIVRAPVKRNKRNRTESIGRYMILGEFTGLGYSKVGKNKVGRTVKLFESSDNGKKFKEKEIILE